MSIRPTFFVDRCVGESVANRIAQPSIDIVYHDVLFPEDTPDVLWIPRVCSEEWSILTKDSKMLRNPLERETLARGMARVFAFASSNLRIDHMVNLFNQNLQQFLDLISTESRPFWYSIHKTGYLDKRDVTPLVDLTDSGDD